jgi:hypothetical protein
LCGCFYVKTCNVPTKEIICPEIVATGSATLKTFVLVPDVLMIV